MEILLLLQILQRGLRLLGSSLEQGSNIGVGVDDHRLQHLAQRRVSCLAPERRKHIGARRQVVQLIQPRAFDRVCGQAG